MSGGVSLREFETGLLWLLMIGSVLFGIVNSQVLNGKVVVSAAASVTVIILSQNLLSFFSVLYGQETDDFLRTQIAAATFLSIVSILVAILICVGVQQEIYSISYGIAGILAILIFFNNELFRVRWWPTFAGARAAGLFISRCYLSLISLFLFSFTPIIDSFFIDDVAAGVYSQQVFYNKIIIMLTSIFVGGFGLAFSSKLSRLGTSADKSRFTGLILEVIVKASLVVITVLILFSGPITSGLSVVLRSEVLGRVDFVGNSLLFFPMLYLTYLVKSLIDGAFVRSLLAIVICFVLTYSISLVFFSVSVRNPFVIALIVSWYTTLCVAVFIKNRVCLRRWFAGLFSS
jgi:hypothetical protein